MSESVDHSLESQFDLPFLVTKVREGERDMKKCRSKRREEEKRKERKEREARRVCAPTPEVVAR